MSSAMLFFLLAAVALSLASLGCGGEAGSAPGDTERGGTSGAATTSSSAASGTAVGEAIAEARLEPVGDSGTSGTAVFKEVGDLGVQVELDVSGLPTKNEGATYYAQVHEGSCSDGRTGEEHEEGHSASSFGPALALVRFDRLLAKAPGLQANGGHEHTLPEESPGSIEQPISFSASADGSASVSSLLEGVEAKRLTSGAPEYVHLHAVGSEDAPELACGDLKPRESS
jgi:hypothetical protein